MLPCIDHLIGAISCPHKYSFASNVSNSFFQSIVVDNRHCAFMRSSSKVAFSIPLRFLREETISRMVLFSDLYRFRISCKAITAFLCFSVSSIRSFVFLKITTLRTNRIHAEKSDWRASLEKSTVER